MIKILYLEDNKFDVELTQIEFRKAFPDAKLDVVNTIEGANKLLEIDAKYDVAILDLNLPDGNGIDILMNIRQQNFPIAVVILTGSGNEESAIAALKAGADDYLTKNQGYLKKLPDIILNVLENFKKNIEKRSKPLNVLYVEWNAPDIEFTKRHMQKYAPHIHIHTVTIATELLNLIPKTADEKCDYDILMMDYRLPGLNALDTVKIIRQERKLSIPIILVTGHGNEAIAVQALKIGVDDYLVKRENYLFRLPSLITSAFQRHELEIKQAALRESEAKYRLLAENSGDVIFIFDLNLHYVYVSPAVKALRGFEVEEALKQNLPEVLTPESLKVAQKVISDFLPEKGKELIAELPPQIVELEMIKKDGSTVWTEVKVSLITDENNFPTGIQGVTRDISKRKKALDELRKLSRAIEQSPASVIITDTNGKIEYVNPNFEKVTGYTFNEVIGENPNILKSGNNPVHIYSDLWQKITNNEIWTGELENKKKDGTTFWEFASISPITNESGISTHYLAVKEDITEKKKYEEELIIARDQAQESDRLKSAFLASMSHELRTPLNAIIGFSGLIDDEMEKSKMIEFSQIINKSGNHLLNIIEDIFNVSMLQTGQSKITSNEFYLSDFFESLIHYSNVELANKKKEFLKVIFQHPTKSKQIIKTDKTKIYQVLINFIKNAIEFTEKGDIKIGYYTENKSVTFFVKDSGIGIPKDKAIIIFERFRQIDDSNTRKHSGVGLGLAICSEIANLLKGEVWVESEVDKGSTFFFMLPDVIESEIIELDINEENINYPDFENKNILIVEDEETNYLLLKIILKKTNANVIWAKSGEESVETCKSNTKFDLILMDIRMPGIDGFEAAKQIKEIQPKLKIVAQTAFALANDRDNVLNSSCDDYISKPIIAKELFNILNKYLKV